MTHDNFSRAWFARMHDVMAGYVERGKVPGIVTLVSRHDEVLQTRLIPATTPLPNGSTCAPRVVAYLYGGQGTLNVPSWSPDGEKLAFVSNTVPF
jgi:hypothetical protein